MASSERPYGSWPTPIDSELVVAAAVRLSEVRVDGTDVVWSEGRPGEGGRTQLVRSALDGGAAVDLLPAEANARTAVHEYGGAAWWVRDGVTWYADWSDQRLYRLAPGNAPEPLTGEPEVPRGDRYADGDVSPDGRTIVCVRERHVPDGGPAQVRNELVVLPADGPGEATVLASGPDFVAAPRWSPDGTAVAYLRWDHPSMPWDATELVVRRDGVETVVAGGPDESVIDPQWTDDGALWFLSDRSGWWNLYRAAPSDTNGERLSVEPDNVEDDDVELDGVEAAGKVEANSVGAANVEVADVEVASVEVASVEARNVEHESVELFTVEPMVRLDAEIGQPAWLLGGSRYAVLADGRVMFARQRDGYDALAVREPDGTVRELENLPFSAYAMVRAAGPDRVVVVAGAPTLEPGVHLITTGGTYTTLRAPRELGLDDGYLSVPEHVSFPSTSPDGGSRTAHALYYPPANPTSHAPAGERPPLLVVIHGGPTGSAIPVLALGLQYWTSRGFAVVDVDYGGSTGYGRAYREQLRDSWGLVDVADCIAAASFLADTGRADPDRLCIRGGSAGGFTTLAALARPDTPFAAGADHFGVSDLQALAAETHKFESRYLDRLVGPYPDAHDVYVARSPITHIDQLTRPLIVLQGSEDAIVPPAQSELIVDALRAKGVPVAYLLFDGEQHGFRRAENIRRAMDAELSFYAQVLGFPPPDGITPVEIDNLD